MDQLKQLFQLSVDMLCVAGTDGYFRDLNPSFERILGYSAEELRQKPFIEFVHPDDRAATLAEVAKLSTGVPTVEFENRYRCKDGSYRWLQWTSRPDNDQGLLYAVARDVTEAKADAERLRQTEEDLRRAHEELEDHYKAVVRASGQLIYDRDPRTGAAAYLNAEPALGYTDDRLVGGQSAWIELIHPDDRARYEEEIGRVGEPGQFMDLEYRVRRSDGSYLSVEDRGYLVQDREGTRLRMVGFVLDISARKRLEDQLRQAQKMEAVGRLAGGIAHDFNNLLTAIMGYGQLMAARLRPDDAALHDTEEILKASARAAMLTRQLLAFSRREVLQPRLLDLNVIVAEMGKMLRRLLGEPVELAVVKGANLGSVKADAGHVEQIIMNLAVNARDAMPDGGRLTIETSNVELREDYAGAHLGVKPGRYVLLAISDTGSGMTPEIQAHIFEPFYTTKGRGEGTGLGLSTVFGIVQQWGGSIQLYSDPGWGTTFKVYFPLVAKSADASRPITTFEDAPSGTETVLVVEDQEAVAAVIRGTLQMCGYSVLEARHGAEALIVCEQHEGAIHLMITDVVMPVMSGPELAPRAWARRPEMKILYVSGYTERAFASHAELDPRSGFLQKPFMPQALASKVRELLDAERAAQT